MKKIMVIEDDPDVSMVLDGLFKMSGYEGYFYSSGEKAVEDVENVFPDLVIMDLMMPGISGFEVCQILRASGKTKNIPLIAITGYDSKENRHKIFLAGIDDYMPKPFDVKMLLQKIENLISK